MEPSAPLTDRRRNIVVLISGSGSNLQAIMNACESGLIPSARVSLVISNRKAAYGLTRATNATPPIRTDYLALQPYLKASPSRTRIDYDLQIAKKIMQLGTPDLVVLAGWMHVLSQEFLEVLNGKRNIDPDASQDPAAHPAERVVNPIPIINLHPALPGAFDGSNAIHRAFQAFQNGEITKTGIMIHRVVPEVDRGAPIVVKEIQMVAGETEEELEERIHKVEHLAIVEGVALVLNGDQQELLKPLGV